MHPHTQQEGMTQRLTAASQHWSGRLVVLWTCTVKKKKTQLERFNSLLQASCVCNYSTWQIWTESNLSSFGFVLSFFSPSAPFISLIRTDRASHYFFVTHIVWILWISSAKPTANVYVVLYWKLCLHMLLYVFSLYRVLILYIDDMCEFYRSRALFGRSHQVNSSTCF